MHQAPGKCFLRKQLSVQFLSSVVPTIHTQETAVLAHYLRSGGKGVDDESVNIYWISCEWKLFKYVQEIRHAIPTFQMFKMELAKWNVGVLKQLEKIFVKWRRKHPSKAGFTASNWYCLPHIFQILLLLSIPTVTQDHDHTIYGSRNLSKLVCPHLGGYSPRHSSYGPLLHQSLRWLYREIPTFLTWL